MIGCATTAVFDGNIQRKGTWKSQAFKQMYPDSHAKCVVILQWPWGSSYVAEWKTFSEGWVNVTRQLCEFFDGRVVLALVG